MVTTFQSLPHELVLHILRLALNSSARSLDINRSLDNLLYSSDLLQSVCLLNKTYCSLTRPYLFCSLQVRSIQSALRIKVVVEESRNRELVQEIIEIGFLITGEMLDRLEVAIDLLRQCKQVEKVNFEASASSRTALSSVSSWPERMNFCRAEGICKPLSSLNISGFNLPISLPHFSSLKSLSLTNITLEDGWKLSEAFPAVTELNFGLSAGKGSIFEETRNFLLNMSPQLKILRLDGSRIMFGSLSVILAKEILSLASSLESLQISHLERDPTLQLQSPNQPPPLPISDPSVPLPLLCLAFDQNQFQHPMRAYSAGDFFFSSSNRRAEGDVFVETFASYTREVSRSLGGVRHISCLSLPPWVEMMGNGMGVLRESESKLRSEGTLVIYETPHPFVRCSAWVQY